MTKVIYNNYNSHLTSLLLVIQYLYTLIETIKTTSNKYMQQKSLRLKDKKSKRNETYL